MFHTTTLQLLRVMWYKNTGAVTSLVEKDKTKNNPGYKGITSLYII